MTTSRTTPTADRRARRDAARLAAREVVVPTLRYPAELPITGRHDELISLLRDHQVVIVAGETGSGKSTQLPKLCLEAGRGTAGMIGHTQPRRLAARTIAERVAEEIGTEVGGAVGYTVRFTDRVGDGTLVKVMTDGILLAETQRDRSLRRYDTIIVDEAHERSLNVDFLLGYLRQLLPRRPDLHVVITSATIDTERFSQHFGDAPVVEVSGRTYPVEVRYRPFGEEPDDDRDQTQAIVDAVHELRAQGPGDVLVFLSGEREIHDTADALRRLDDPDTEVLPLYARLPAKEQHRIFEPHRHRRVVLATNVAETSLTVPGIRYVVDAGTARISRYSRRLKVQRLPIEPVSQASANQRAGRCGRVAPGVAIRLFSEDDFAARPEFTEPEILRTNLASVLLQMAALGLGDVAAFPFVDPPDSRAVKDGIALLEELGAFRPGEPDPHRRLTDLGRRLSRLPIDPRLGRMILQADREGCVREVLVIAAALSIQDPRERPADQQQAAADAHRRFADEHSDFVSFWNLWQHLRAQQRALSSNQFRKLCRNEFLSYVRVREWQDLVSQLRQVAAELGVHQGTEPGTPEAIHRSLLSGLLSHLGMRDGTTREFTGARGARFVIGSGSTLARKPPKWVMAGELVETNRLWARVVARVEPDWAERLGEHLVKRTYSEPRWDRDRGSAVATERVTLYGLPIVANRTVPYGRIDPVEARRLFVWHALVEGEWDAHHAFIRENERRLAAVRALEQRVRRYDLAADEEARFDLFDERVPAHVVSVRHFDRWWKQACRETPDLLTFTVAELVDPAAGRIDPDDYPDDWWYDDLHLTVSYEFDPGSPTDGVTVHVPVLVLNRLGPEGFDWLVPGHREELVAAWIRSLPKVVRRQLVPVGDRAAAFVAEGSPEDGPLLDVLAAFLTRTAPVTVRPSMFDPTRMPDHLRMTFSIDGDDGHPIAAGKDLAALQRRLSGRVRDALSEAAPVEERNGLTSWDLGALPRAVRARQGAHVATAYPTLVDEGETAGIRIVATEEEQARHMRAGTARLVLLALASPRKAVERLLPADAKLALASKRHGGLAALLDECTTAAVTRLVDAHGGPVWDEASFDALTEAVRGDVVEEVLAVASRAARAIALAAAIERRIASLSAPSLQPALGDAREQLTLLAGPGFVTRWGAARLPDLLRYLRALGRRIEKLPADVAGDRLRMQRVRDLEDELRHRRTTLPPSRADAADHVERMLQELRVGEFAQVVGTAFPVSEQRVRKALAALAP